MNEFRAHSKFGTFLLGKLKNETQGTLFTGTVHLAFMDLCETILERFLNSCMLQECKFIEVMFGYNHRNLILLN